MKGLQLESGGLSLLSLLELIRLKHVYRRHRRVVHARGTPQVSGDLWPSGRYDKPTHLMASMVSSWFWKQTCLHSTFGA
eukprot:5729107-Amphidinium_carterae.1